VLVARGVADNMQKVFKKYLSRGNKGCARRVARDGEAIEAIHAAGGLAVLAHPSRYNLTAKWIKRLLVAFKAVGGCHGGLPAPAEPQERANLGQWAREHDLYISVGPIFTSSNWTELGRHLWLPKEGMPLWLGHPGHFGLTPRSMPAGQPLTPGPAS
jgi:predicted metal-dependent phosphoesterase TrpH